MQHIFLRGAGILTLFASMGAVAAEIPAPLDRAYIGPIDLEVDARNVAQKIFKVHERIPVKPGHLVLLYPQWRLGVHAPADSALSQLAGLQLHADRQRIEWRRDPVNVWAFHLDVPKGVSALEAEFDFLSPVEANQGAILATEAIVAIHWESLLLYPAGVYAHGVIFKPSIRFPDGWQFAGALQTREAGHAIFRPVDLEELIDSPIYAGRFFRRIDLDPGATVPVTLDLFADDAASLAGSPAQFEAHRELVRQAYALFGSHHYAHYDFLMALSDEFGFSGLEHHQSGENGVRSTYFSDWDHQQAWRSGLVSHEYIHSWDGKFRRPADQLTANLNLPMQDSLLWVYEGATSYWGHVLGARSGLVETTQMRDALAATAALYDHRVGRTWRTLQDTTNEPVINRRRPLGWISWQRAEDYYSEGELVWLDADTKIRELSGEKRSLDDFARFFFGVADGRHTPLAYTFQDVVNALNAVQRYDWAGFLHARLDGHGPGAPLDGITRSGWRLVYTEQPTPFFTDVESYRKVTDFSYSLGFSVDTDGRIADVLWDGAAFKAGLSQGYALLAVNGRAYKPALLKAAISTAKTDRPPIELLLKKGDRYTTMKLDYHEGLRYPRLAPVAGAVDRLGAIFRPLPP